MVAFMAVTALVGNAGNVVALEAAAALGLTSLQSDFIFAAVFFYFQAIGSLVIPPYSEAFGRKQTNIAASLGFAAMCAICSINSVIAVVFGRAIGGFLSAMPAMVGAGLVEDMWSIRGRVWALDMWIKGAITGIALGPCFATFVSTSELHWPWVFRLGAILAALNSISFLCSKESRLNRIMAQQISIVSKTTGYAQLVPESTQTVPTLQVFVTTMMLRPVKMFFTEPIVCTISIMSGTVYGSVFLLTPGLTVAYEAFGYTERQASLVFIAWIIGLTLTIPLRMLDFRLVSQALRSHRAVTPEDKITGFFVAAPVLACSMWWWSWTVPPSAALLSPWISIPALVLVGACVNEFDGILQGYLVDSYTTYAASANAPLAFLRAILSGSFPLFGRQLYEGLGSNISGSIVASVATIFGPIAVCFWLYGAQIRQRSPMASTAQKE